MYCRVSFKRLKEAGGGRGTNCVCEEGVGGAGRRREGGRKKQRKEEWKGDRRREEKRRVR